MSRIGRISRAFVVSMAVVLGMSACGGYTVGFMWVTVAGAISDRIGRRRAMVSAVSFGPAVATTVTTPLLSVAVPFGGNFDFTQSMNATGGVVAACVAARAHGAAGKAVGDSALGARAAFYAAGRVRVGHARPHRFNLRTLRRRG